MDAEKGSSTHSEIDIQKEQSVQEVEDIHEYGVLEIDARAERRLIRKLDIRMVTLGTLMHMLCVFDRSNMGNAKILNDDTGDSLQQSLKLNDNHYLIALVAFYISYGLFEVPSNYFLKKYKPSRWFALLMLLWGATTMATASVQTYPGLVVSRLILGVLQSGIFPSLVYCLTFWYKPEERAFRIAIILAGATMGDAFGGAVAFGVGLINRTAGLQGWRWLFLIEGVPTIVLAPVVFFVFPDFPENALWLPAHERELAIARVRGVASLGHVKVTWADVRSVMVDWRLYLHYLMWIAYQVSFSSISFFAPTIVRGLGFEGLSAQLFTVPPYSIAFAVAVCVGWLTDRLDARSWMAIGAYSSCAVCFLTQGLLPPTAFAARYAVLCLAVSSVFSLVGPQLSWLTANLRNTGATTIALPLSVSISVSGQIIGLFIYKDSESPAFPTGHFTIAGFTFFAAALGLVLRSVYSSRNRKLSPGEPRWRL